MMKSGFAGFGSQFTRSSVKIGDDTVFYLKGVHGDPLVYLHGLGGWGQWERHIFGFAVNYCVYAPQLPGWKDGRVPERVKSVRDYAQIVMEFLDAVGIKRAVIAGHSIGGWIAQYIAVEHPEMVSKLMLIDPLGVDLPTAPATDLANLDQATFARAAFPKAEKVRVAGDFGDTVEAIQASEEFQNQWKGRELLVNLVKGKYSDPELTKRLGAIKADTLIVWGREDEIVPLQHGELLAKAIPNAKFAVIESASHTPMRYKPETFNTIARSFLLNLPYELPTGLATLVKV